jgi:S1-C subfamily serine protease
MFKNFIVLVFVISSLFANTKQSQSVVKIFASVSIPNYKYPWQTPKISQFSGSGAIIANHQILTSAHVVSGAKYIEIKKENDPKKYLAHLKYISHQADLALLELEDKDFFIGTKPLKINKKIKHRDEVTVLGYPIGGDTISSTTGVVSRIEYINYVWSGDYLPAIQIDAAINSGNSGGPTIDKDGNLVGIAMMKLERSSNIAYIVPSIIINNFLEDIKDNKVNGFFKLDTYYQNIENNSLKNYYGLKNGNGILINKTDLHDKILQRNDIVLSIDSQEIANDGTIESEFGRINFKLLLDTKQIGETVTLKVLRDKKIITLNYPILNQKPLITTEFVQDPRYFIFGGLTFTPVTQNYLRTVGISKNGVQRYLSNIDSNKEVTELVSWMQTIFPHDINRGYFSNSFIVKSVNGIDIKSLNHFVQVIDNTKEEYIKINFMEQMQVILNTKKAKESFRQISKIYNLYSDRKLQ